ncbi:MAG: hypothetical protein JOS17DRAFT_790494 [Linnemannia elongata]|nr:MAG: hypothetical protein JOS17DRAFT_790494 [Linnemannia elongata]
MPFDSDSTIVTLAVQRHSTTLQGIYLEGIYYNLYRRIGALTVLQELDLIIVPIHDTGDVGTVDVSRIVDAKSFPAMLNLADSETGRPGYLHYMAGLRDLMVCKGRFVRIRQGPT